MSHVAKSASAFVRAFLAIPVFELADMVAQLVCQAKLAGVHGAVACRWQREHSSPMGWDAEDVALLKSSRPQDGAPRRSCVVLDIAITPVCANPTRSDLKRGHRLPTAKTRMQTQIRDGQLALSAVAFSAFIARVPAAGDRTATKLSGAAEARG